MLEQILHSLNKEIVLVVLKGNQLQHSQLLEEFIVETKKYPDRRRVIVYQVLFTFFINAVVFQNWSSASGTVMVQRPLTSGFEANACALLVTNQNKTNLILPS